MSDATDCLFCGFVSGAMQPDVVLETATTLAFRDINPQAPTHVLVVPKAHHRDLAALTRADPTLVGELFATVAAVAEDAGLDSGYRVVLNTGPDAGQSVPHVHAHVLGGRGLAWPPG